MLRPESFSIQESSGVMYLAPHPKRWAQENSAIRGTRTMRICQNILLLIGILGFTAFAPGSEISFRHLKVELPKGEKIAKPFKPEEGERDSVLGELVDRDGEKSSIVISDLGDVSVPIYGVLFKSRKAWNSSIGVISRQSVFLEDIGKGVMLIRVTIKGNGRYDLIVTVSNKAKLAEWEGHSRRMFPPLKKDAHSSEAPNEPKKPNKTVNPAADRL